MCPDCQEEYEDPANRRFHAQPNACPVCGPTYQLLDYHGRSFPMVPNCDIFSEARRLIATGKILAIKGLGGYHLACNAKDETAVTRLRSRKNRESKPFAVMFGSLIAAKKSCHISPAEEDLLIGAVKPIVLLDKGPDYILAAAVAPDNPRIGVMLPYAPVQELLLATDDVWIMTSGNTSDEPIAYQDEDALERLSSIADFFLVHNRPIYRRADDSVTRVFQNAPYIFRRSRGFTPAPINLKHAVDPILACGAELKNTFCLTHNNQAFLSAHIGDLENMPTLNYYTESIEHYKRLLRIEPKLVAYDLHPEYLSSKYALSLDLPKVAVQHHHAHIASVMAEHMIEGPVIGVAFDGTGYGADGTLWGGEFLIADYNRFQRVAHCRYLALPGGAKAIKEPWRLAAWVLHEIYAENLTNLDIPFTRNLPSAWSLIKQAATKNINMPISSSAGRLFDIAAAIIGLRNNINYEGQAAIELELLAGQASGEILPYEVCLGEVRQLNFMPTFTALVNMIKTGRPLQHVAASFHSTIAMATVEIIKAINCETDIKRVALSGGVFQNIRLLADVHRLLEQQGFEVLIHRKVPANDGGLALGQATIAAAQMIANSV
jgi:hydrogenase maturation protein HypF